MDFYDLLSPKLAKLHRYEALRADLGAEVVAARIRVLRSQRRAVVEGLDVVQLYSHRIVANLGFNLLFSVDIYDLLILDDASTWVIYMCSRSRKSGR